MSDAEMKSLFADINDLTKGWERAAPSGILRLLRRRIYPLTDSKRPDHMKELELFRFGLGPPTEPSLLTDSEWGSVDGDACRVSQFSPFGWLEEGRICVPKRIPYAAIHFECTRMPGTIKGYITHKMDFLHLWQAFIERGVRDDEEVVAYWTIQNYKFKWLRHFSVFLPKLWVTVSRKGFFEFMKGRQEARGQRTTEEIIESVASWKPGIMR
ncbi:MAG: hypothetical protein WBD63_08645 [Phycisphaerae bacterium]|nr:hypothetical protein [Phycisphaerae bacterium]